MVADVQAFVCARKSRDYPHLTVENQVIADEDHLTLSPALITRGLKWAYAPVRQEGVNTFAQVDGRHQASAQTAALPAAPRH